MFEEKILESHGLRDSEKMTEYMFLRFSDPQAPSLKIITYGKGTLCWNEQEKEEEEDFLLSLSLYQLSQ